MPNMPLMAISPVDGRYQGKTDELQSICSEFALIKYRIQVELAWFEHLSDTAAIQEIPALSAATKKTLKQWRDEFSIADAEDIKARETKINHDVKAVEYFLKERFDQIPELSSHKEFIHFACTSEDINNLAYALMLRDMRRIIFVATDSLIHAIADLAHQTADAAMLCRTHGQAATPSTMGKELANFVYRLRRQIDLLQQIPLLGKINGAVGNYNAHVLAYPDIDWPALSKDFVEQKLGLAFNPYTTQIEPHDYMAELFDGMRRFNTIMLGFCRDIWNYVALGYFRQKTLQQEVGSSTMPHKVNPIDFENAEGNLGIANSLWHHFSEKLPISRLQRDLSDSTVLRNIGVGFAHSLLAYQSSLRGIAKLQIDRPRLHEELDNNWQVLAEAIQTILRRHQSDDPYEKLKALTRGKTIQANQLHAFINALNLPADVKKTMLQLTPQTYIGYANKLAQDI